jgi:hypothetical protein
MFSSRFPQNKKGMRSLATPSNLETATNEHTPLCAETHIREVTCVNIEKKTQGGNKNVIIPSHSAFFSDLEGNLSRVCR